MDYSQIKHVGAVGVFFSRSILRSRKEPLLETCGTEIVEPKEIANVGHWWVPSSTSGSS